MFNDVCHIIKLSQLVAVVVTEHAFGTDDGVTELAEVLYFLVLMLVAEDLALVRLGHLDLWDRLLALSGTHWHRPSAPLVDTVHLVQVHSLKSFREPFRLLLVSLALSLTFCTPYLRENFHDLFVGWENVV